MTAVHSVSVARPVDGVALIEMGEPGSLNLWDTDLELGLLDALDELGADPGTRAIGLVSRGRAFCGGADLSRVRALLAADRPAAEVADDVLERRITRALDTPTPVVAGIHGACVGIGLALALACDIRVAATDARFRAAFPERGLIAEHGTSWLLPRIVGLGDALDMLLSSRTVDAEEAHAMRLVSRLVEPDDLRAGVLQVLTRIAGTVSPRSAAVIKEQVYADQGRPVEPALRAAANEMAAAFRAPDATEGVRSFLEKRPAQFPPYPPATGPAPTVEKENRS
ncbi:enoyl-CoA hydratase-related protein [Blastococcus mobilis]|uniref:Enoyl-CoA hydratase/carnithine racemase n=1 Tax=Blastococcus mobilis TaxID=1938746 RepID=A0A238Y203_9ACTN|nr:enoyl-CoA hydratase-related protein [Blastococcus mobilis]SNR65316.1 Enoyl-CoA hydratase/carnithine racemase [Blastococcus mobilis]